MQVSLEEPFRFNPAMASAPSPANDSLERQTRQEISSLVAELGQLSRSHCSMPEFWNGYVSRLSRAMAAEGVTIWSLSDPSEPQSIMALGELSVDPQHAGHRLLLAEVFQSMKPVLVPPSAGEQTGPINPTNAWAALIPIDVEGRWPTVIEAFLHEVGGPASQRGYLRFAAQMGDLACEYLRSNALRHWHRMSDAWQRWQTVLKSLHAASNSPEFKRRAVDGLAQCLQVNRVSWLDRRVNGWTLSACNGIDAPDPRGPAGLWLSKLVRSHLRGEPIDQTDNPTGVQVLAIQGLAHLHDSPPQFQRIADMSFLEEIPNNLQAKSTVGETPYAAIVIQHDSDSGWSPEQAAFAAPLFQSVNGAYRGLQVAESIPLLGKWAMRRGHRNISLRRRVTIATLAIAACAILMIPVPFQVIAPATLEPIGTVTMQAPRDAVVQSLLVEHQQQVLPNTPLLQLTDLELDREEEKLLGQRSILEKRGAELQRLLVRSNDDVKRLEWETENAEIQTEKQTIEKQLAWVQTQRASLTVRSPVNGSVEAWESAQKLVGKQVRRGETLLDVVDETKGWRIRAEIPQTRLDHVLYALQDQSSLPVSVTLISFPQRLIHGQVTSLGPTTAAGHDGLPVGWTDVQVAAADLPMKQAGAAATVAIRCGRRPLGYIVFQDFIRASWGWWKLWIG